MTRPIDEAIRAACSRWHPQDCTYPGCGCAPVVPDMIRAARDVFFADTPENRKAVAHAMITDDPILLGMLSKTELNETASAILAELRARWGDEG